MKDDYTMHLEEVIKQMLTPLKNIPFNLVIETIANTEVVPFEITDPNDKILLEDLKKVAELSGKKVNENGIISKRANEVGNKIEPFVIRELISYGYKAGVPVTTAGRAKSTGYPDIAFIDKAKRKNYLECKTYNMGSLDMTLRSFYLSPSSDFKVTANGHHFALSYEIIERQRNATTNLYLCKAWKLLSLENLLVNVKYEFNADNVHLYDEKLILAEGKIL